MAKITDLTDQQLEKTFRQYRLRYKTQRSEKLKKALLQMEQEIQKRRQKKQANSSDSQASSVGLGSNISQLARAAEDSMRMRKTTAAQKGNLGKKIRKGPGPVIPVGKSNIYLAISLIVGAIGLILVADDYSVQWIPNFAFKEGFYWFCLITGIASSVTLSKLVDDNR
ncbi:MAG: hypothetical protein HQL32_06415 [Planctomycetes bacterium]|nr:hypothetical protein [Planctomycetota bacterium]